MRSTWMALVCVVLGLCCGCEELGERFEYRGSRLLDPGNYRVSTAAWLGTVPVVFAMRLEEDSTDAERVLRFVPIGEASFEACSTMAGARFIAVERDGEFRTAVLSRDTGRLDFFDEHCGAVGPSFDDAIEVDYISDYRFLVTTSGKGDDVFVAHPFEDRFDVLGRGLQAVSLLPVQVSSQSARPAEGAWVLHDGVLSLRDLKGSERGPRFEGVTRFTTYRGFALGATGMMAYADDGGVHVVTYDARGDGPVETVEVWEEADACTHSFADVGEIVDIDSCDAPECRIFAERGYTGEITLGREAWISMYQPCDERRLVLRSISGDQRYEIASGVREYLVADQGSLEGPVVFYSTADGDAAGDAVDTHFYKVGDAPPIDMGVPVDLSVLNEDRAYWPQMRVTTTESPRRFGLWHPDRGFKELVTGVYRQGDTSMVLHDYDSSTGTGTLSLCGNECRELAQKVRPGRYRKYRTLERIGEGPQLLAYVHDEAPGQAGGTLTVLNREAGLEVDLDEGVSSFVPIENGPARGIVYDVRGGDREGLWFAPR